MARLTRHKVRKPNKKGEILSPLTGRLHDTIVGPTGRSDDRIV